MRGDPELMTPAQASHAFQVSVVDLTRALRSGALPSVPGPGGQLLVDPARLARSAVQVVVTAANSSRRRDG